MEVLASTSADEDPELDVDNEESSPLDISRVPITITLTKVSTVCVHCFNMLHVLDFTLAKCDCYGKWQLLHSCSALWPSQ